MARTMGGAPWTDEEEATLRERWHLDSPAQLSSKLGRTPVALRERARKLGLNAGEGYGHYSLDEAAEALGISRHAAWRLIKAGKMRTIHGRLRHWVTVEEVTRLERVIVTEPPAGYMSATEAADRLGYHRSNLATLCRRRLLDGVKVSGVWYVPVASIADIARDLAATGSLRAVWVNRSPEHQAYLARQAQIKRERCRRQLLTCMTCKAKFPKRPGSGKQRRRCEGCRRSEPWSLPNTIVCKACGIRFERTRQRGRRPIYCGGCRERV